MKKIFLAMAVVLLSAVMFTSCESKGNDPTVAGPINKQWSYEFQQVGWVETNILDLSVVGKISMAYTRSTWDSYTINLDNVTVDSVIYYDDAKTKCAVCYTNPKTSSPVRLEFKDITATSVNMVTGGGTMVQPYTKSDISYR